MPSNTNDEQRARHVHQVHHGHRVHQYETLTLDTAPALFEATIHGWRVRASGTDTRRSNSATCLNPSGADLAATVAEIEAWFAAHQQAPVFRLTDGLTPSGSDELLAQRGYQRAVDCSFMTRAIAAAAPAEDASILLHPLTIEDGTALLHRFKGTEPTKAAIEITRQAQWQGRQRFIELRVDGETAALGLGRLDGSHMGIFNMFTQPAFRGRGLAARVLEALCEWGAANGADTAFLQVEWDNPAACALYEKLGFVAAYSYWHRIR